MEVDEHSFIWTYLQEKGEEEVVNFNRVYF